MHNITIMVVNQAGNQGIATIECVTEQLNDSESEKSEYSSFESSKSSENPHQSSNKDDPSDSNGFELFTTLFSSYS